MLSIFIISTLIPITFMIRNEKANRNFAVSVLDFNSESNMMYVPDWIFHNLYPIEFGDMISVSLYSGGTSEKNIPKGTYVKFRPHNYEFLQLSNHKENIGGRIEKLWFIE